MTIPVQHIDEDKLYTDLGYRYQYLCDFIGITEEDITLIHGSAAVLGPKVEGLVDAVYDKLFAFSSTKKIFFKERSKYDAPSTEESLDNYNLNKPQIGMRKSSLKRFIVRLVTKPYDGDMLAELDRMGRIHTPKGGSTSINVELIHMQALLAYLQDALISTLFTYKNSCEEGSEEFDAEGTVRAFCKVLAVQNQFICRWYEDPASRVNSPTRSTFIPLLAITGALTAAITYLAVSK